MSTVSSFHTDDAGQERLDEIRRLLVRAFDGDFSDDDWQHALGGWHVIAEDAGRVVGHGSVVPRILEIGGTEYAAGYVEAVATDPSHRRLGVGTLVMTRIGEVIRSRFAIGVLSTGAHGFYEALGWERWRGPAFVRDGDRRIRTPSEDDGIMVLRSDPSADVDLGDPIACDVRAGDAW